MLSKHVHDIAEATGAPAAAPIAATATAMAAPVGIASATSTAASFQPMAVDELLPKAAELDSLSRIVQKACSEMMRRFGKEVQQPHRAVSQMCTFVHPLFAPTLDISSAALQRLVRDSVPMTKPASTTSPPPSPPRPAWVSAAVDDPLLDEINHYGAACAEERSGGLSRGFSAFRWWQMNERRFPIVAAAAKRWLAIPASSADLERLFSTAGWIARPHRNRLSHKTLCALLLLHAASKLKVIEKNRMRSLPARILRARYHQKRRKMMRACLLQRLRPPCQP
jgi:hypothetical protein